MHRRPLQLQKSGTSSSGLLGIGRISTPVSGMRVLNQAATAYTKISTEIAASGAVSMPVSMIGTSIESRCAEITLPTSWPPKRMPRMIEAIVRPSIQPLAFTSCDAGSISVRMPYLAGE